MNYNKYLVKKGKTDLASSLRAINKKIIDEELEYRNLKNIGELKKDIIEDFKFCLESSKDDLNTIMYFTEILENENTNQMVIFDDDIEALWAFVYKSNGEYSYYIADEIKEIILKNIDSEELVKQSDEVDEQNSELRNYINNISDRYLNELYKKVEFKNQYLSKQENVISEINKKFIEKLLTIDIEWLKQIKQISEGEIPKEINKNIKDIFVFYDKYGNKEYFIPENIKEAIRQINIEELANSRKKTATSFYVEANGIIKLDKLIELAKATGVDITKKEIREICKELDYYIDSDMVYLNKKLYDLDLCKDLLEIKKEVGYKTYTMLEILLRLPIIISNDFFVKILKIIYKKTKNKTLATDITNMILMYTRMSVDYEGKVLELLKEKDIRLTHKEEENLFDILDETSLIYPKWALNGGEEDIFDEDLFDEFFEELEEEEVMEIYISQYIAINGVIPIEKMIEVLKYHNINTTKKELMKIVKKAEGINISKEYICFKGVEKYIDQILMTKLTEEFKIIEDIDEFIDELEFNSQRIIDICLKYGISEENGKEILAFMTYGTFEKELLNITLMENNNILPKGVLDSLYNELMEISKEIRTWKYNGYTENEIINKK